MPEEEQGRGAHLIAVWPLAKAGCIASPEAAIGCRHKLAKIASITACLLTEHLLQHITLLAVMQWSQLTRPEGMTIIWQWFARG